MSGLAGGRVAGSITRLVVARFHLIFAVRVSLAAAVLRESSAALSDRVRSILFRAVCDPWVLHAASTLHSASRRGIGTTEERSKVIRQLLPIVELRLWVSGTN